MLDRVAAGKTASSGMIRGVFCSSAAMPEVVLGRTWQWRPGDLSHTPQVIPLTATPAAVGYGYRYSADGHSAMQLLHINIRGHTLMGARRKR
jgi:hypothetical protein